jgi:hypothetical protein
LLLHSRAMQIRDIIARMRHDGCGGRAGKVELITGIEGASSRPVRRGGVAACRISFGRYGSASSDVRRLDG